MANIIAILVVLGIVGLAAGYVIRAKKRGKRCIGCPDACSCGRSGLGSCGGCGK